MDAAIWGFVGVIVGGLITVGAEIIRARNTASLDSVKRADDRALARDAFQRQNLLELQERLAEWIRAQGRGTFFDQMTLRATGKLTLWPEEIDAETFETSRQVRYRVQRVKDDGLRANVAALMSRGAELEVERDVYHEKATEESLSAELSELTGLYTAVEDQLGKKLREYL